MSNEKIPVNEIGEMMDVVSDKLPNMIKNIYNTIFSEEGASTMGQAVATFYKHLVDTGMDKKDAMKLTSDYMNTLKSMTDQIKTNS